MTGTFTKIAFYSLKATYPYEVKQTYSRMSNNFHKLQKLLKIANSNCHGENDNH